jgi:hypothetical protein
MAITGLDMRSSLIKNDALLKRLFSALIVTPVKTGVTKKVKNDVMTQPVSPV